MPEDQYQSGALEGLQRGKSGWNGRSVAEESLRSMYYVVADT